MDSDNTDDTKFNKVHLKRHTRWLFCICLCIPNLFYQVTKVFIPSIICASNVPSIDSKEDGESRSVKVRNLSGFWLLGLCNNFGYVIMLSAAHDILTPVSMTNLTNATVENRTGKLIEFCNPIGTGAILLADVLPSLLVKLTGSFYLHLLSYRFKVWLVILLNVASFLLVAFGGSTVVWLSVLGVIFASIGSGMGEFTFLGLTAYFNKNEISTWSSGTGAAGVFGALSYAGLTALRVSPKNTLLIMLIVPFLLGLTYFVLLVKPASVAIGHSSIRDESENELLRTPSSSDELETKQITFIDRLRLIQPLFKFMIPLFLVYFAEYVINQALFELVYFNNIWLRREEQYRWYQVIYQIGVFISRSSVNIVRIPQVSIFAILQFANLTLFVLQVHYKFIPNIWLVFCLILFEGLMGGGAYVNSFYHISKQVKEQYREFSMGVTCVSDSFGVTIAAAVSIPVHNYLCRL